ncbi:MAG: hypothetical protein KDC48_21945 [Planctomycetes bacterium]|nr:hypothetical protein [Planctomycetota bacterium]
MTETAALRTVRIAHSPDSDDAFMFYALTERKIVTPGVEYEHVLADIETLNEAALEGFYEVSAVSIHGYTRIADQYQLMPCGASMGEGYGPVVIGLRALPSLRGRRVAIPGPWTSAALALRLFEPEVEPVDYGITKPLRSHNPVVIAFHEWAAMGRDVARARSIRGALGAVFASPGWREDGEHETVKALMQRRAAQAPAE